MSLKMKFCCRPYSRPCESPVKVKLLKNEQKCSFYRGVRLTEVISDKHLLLGTLSVRRREAVSVVLDVRLKTFQFYFISKQRAQQVSFTMQDLRFPDYFFLSKAYRIQFRYFPKTMIYLHIFTDNQSFEKVQIWYPSRLQLHTDVQRK